MVALTEQELESFIISLHLHDDRPQCACTESHLFIEARLCMKAGLPQQTGPCRVLQGTPEVCGSALWPP